MVIKKKEEHKQYNSSNLIPKNGKKKNGQRRQMVVLQRCFCSFQTVTSNHLRSLKRKKKWYLKKKFIFWAFFCVIVVVCKALLELTKRKNCQQVKPLSALFQRLVYNLAREFEIYANLAQAGTNIIFMTFTHFVYTLGWIHLTIIISLKHTHILLHRMIISAILNILLWSMCQL